MKTKNPFFLAALIAGLSLIPAGQAVAQTFTTVYSFTASSIDSFGVYTNADGATPFAGLIIAGNRNTRYGTAANGGPHGYGTVFAVNADGTGFTNLHSFASSDGANPWAGLILLGDTLYGTAYRGGSAGWGTVFAVKTDGTGFTNLHTFTYTEGASPNGGLILANNILYGTTAYGGSWGSGTVFAVNTDGTGFTNLYNFTGGTDGAVPVAGLILAGDFLYGTATGGGDGGNGTLFKTRVDGTGFITLYSFSPTEQIIICSNGRCPTGYRCEGGICVYVGIGGGGCNCPAGSHCFGGFCACAGFCSEY